MPRRAAKRLGLWLGTAALLGWLTAACLFGDVEHEVTSLQISGGRVMGTLLLPSMVRLGRDELQIELFEDGRRLGPEVETAKAVREARSGTYAVLAGRWPVWSPTRLTFSASDGSTPRSNGRLYRVRYPRRQLPAAMALLLGSWIVLPLATLHLSRRGADAPPRASGSCGAAAWSVAALGALYTLFAVQAWLPPPNTAWFVALLAIGLLPFLARLARRQAGLPDWVPWLAGLLAWAALTSVANSSYASTATAAAFVAVSVGGLAVDLGMRGALQPCEDRRPLVLGLLVFAVGLSLARDAGFDLAGSLASLGLSAVWPSQLVNPWTTKFLAHWLLVVLWFSLAALSAHGPSGRRTTLWIGGAGLVALGANGSRAALAALLVSAAIAAVALAWPRAARRLVVSGLVGGLLLAPLLAAAPWRARSELAGGEGGAVWSGVDLDERSGKWELSRRLIALRPVQGWGFGASGRLPGRDLSVTEALGPSPREGGPPASDTPAFAGGHPHNAALLTWLDLGLVGALLAAGLVAALGRSIGSVEKDRGVHAALLGLLSVTATYLVFNYPVWEPEIASLLWMSVVLPSTVLPSVQPRPATQRRRILRGGLAALVVVGIGCAVLAQDRLSRSSTERRFRDAELIVDGEGRRLAVGGGALPVHADRGLVAGAELVGAGPGRTAAIHGWVEGPPAAGPSGAVLVFVGSELAGIVWPERPTPELLRRSESKDVRSLVSGFVLPIEPEGLDLEAPVTIVSLGSEGDLAVGLPPLTAAGGPGAPDLTSGRRAPAGPPATAPRTAAPRSAGPTPPPAP